MTQDHLILAMVSLNIIQGVFIIWSSHRFVNKAMSRNYFEYEQSKAYTPVVKQRNNSFTVEQEQDELAII